MSYSPNLPVSSGWKSTIENAFQVLRRIKFIIEGDFSFGDFDPQTNYQGMTTSGYQVYRARYLKIGDMFWFSYNSLASVAAPLTSTITITIPFTAKTRVGDRQQGGAGFTSSAGAAECAFWNILSGTNTVRFHRYAGNNWAAGFVELAVNGFIEVN